MLIFVRLLTLLSCCLPVLSIRHSAESRAVVAGVDRRIGLIAAQHAASNPRRTVAWLRRQRGVAAHLGPDGRTIEMRFADGRKIAILAGDVKGVRLAASAVRLAHFQVGARAVVLEPFASELALGANAGRPEADTLSSAGFTVDRLIDGQVTVAAMRTLPHYSVIYMETHAGLLSGGDAVVATGQTDMAGEQALLDDHSLIQVLVAGDPSHQLYLGVTSAFVTRYMASFRNHTLLFLNGCQLLAAPEFWTALSGRHVGTLISWDQDVSGSLEGEAARVVLDRLAAGDSVSAALRVAHDDGVDLSVVDGHVSRLGFLGDGANTLAAAMDAAGTPPPGGHRTYRPRQAEPQ